MKRPSFQFYPSDWRNDAALRLVSLSARGLWWEMLCLMHMAEPYGHLMAAGRPVDVIGLSRLVGEAPKDVTRWLNELRSHAVFSENDAGVIYCRRMVRDQNERDKWGERQRQHRDNTRDNDVTSTVTKRGKDRDRPPNVTVDVTPMSQLSSSSSSIQGSANGKGTRTRTGERWWDTTNGVIEKAKKIGIFPGVGESADAFKDRVFKANEAQSRT